MSGANVFHGQGIILKNRNEIYAQIGILWMRLSLGMVIRAGFHFMVCILPFFVILVRDLVLGMNISEFVRTRASGRVDPTGGRNRWAKQSSWFLPFLILFQAAFRSGN